MRLVDQVFLASFAVQNRYDGGCLVQVGLLATHLVLLRFLAAVLALGVYFLNHFLERKGRFFLDIRHLADLSLALHSAGDAALMSIIDGNQRIGIVVFNEAEPAGCVDSATPGFNDAQLI